MVRVIKVAQPDRMVNNYFNSKANIEYYDALLPEQRLAYLKNLSANPLEQERLLSYMKKEQLDLYAERIDEIEKKINEFNYAKMIGTKIPYTKLRDEYKKLYNMRGHLIRKSEDLAGVNQTFGNPYISERSGANYVQGLTATLPVDQLEEKKYGGYTIFNLNKGTKPDGVKT